MDEGLSDKSEIVVLANVLENHGGSKYSWYAAQLVREIRNPEKLKLPKSLDIAVFNTDNRLQLGESVLYLVRYNPDHPEYGWRALR